MTTKQLLCRLSMHMYCICPALLSPLCMYSIVISRCSPPGLRIYFSHGYTRIWCRAVIQGRLRAISPLRRTPRLRPEWVDKVNQAVPDRRRQWPNLKLYGRLAELLIRTREGCVARNIGSNTHPVDPMISRKFRRHIGSEAPCGIQACR